MIKINGKTLEQLEQEVDDNMADIDVGPLVSRVKELEAEVERLEKDLEESIKTNFTLPCDGRCTECANQHRCYLEDAHRKIKTDYAALQAKLEAVRGASVLPLPQQDITRVVLPSVEVLRAYNRMCEALNTGEKDEDND